VEKHGFKDLAQL